LLGSDGNWEELVLRAVLHAGDNDSTGTIACALYGLLYGYAGVPEANHKNVEFRAKYVIA
jgi:ADP-ribosylglycohydrolase